MRICRPSRVTRWLVAPIQIEHSRQRQREGSDELQVLADNQYRDTDSFGRDDLPLVAKLADHAHTFIFEQLAKLRAEQSE